MSRTNPRQGLFNGYWTDLQGKRIRRIRQNEYGELYRLNSKHQDIIKGDPVRMSRTATAHQLGVTPLGRIPLLRNRTDVR